MITTSAPGSIMICGEHAVLQGATAVAGAIDRRVQVCLLPRRDNLIRIHSALGNREMQLDRMDDSPPFSFLVRSALAASGPLLRGFDLEVQADMPPDVGLGSSAAVSVAVYAAVYLLDRSALPALPEMQQEVLQVIRSIQGMASGTDVAASLYGGVIAYNQDEGVLEQFYDFPEVELYYVGYKTPTAAVIQTVTRMRAQEPDYFAALDRKMHCSSTDVREAWRRQDWALLGPVFVQAQSVMEQFGVCDVSLRVLIEILRAQPGITGCKISGSGMGDCVLAVGRALRPDAIPYRCIPVSFCSEGLRTEVS